VVASILAGIHYGIIQNIEPPKISTGDAILKHKPSLPMTWVESLDAFSKSKILKKYFGKEFYHVYYKTKYKEMKKFDSHITPLELDWYLRTV
jgi:glutamine synthetase